MTDDPRVLETLQKILAAQQELIALQRQSGEEHARIVAENQATIAKSVDMQRRSVRLQRIALIAGGAIVFLLIAVLAVAAALRR